MRSADALGQQQRLRECSETAAEGGKLKGCTDGGTAGRKGQQAPQAGMPSRQRQRQQQAGTASRRQEQDACRAAPPYALVDVGCNHAHAWCAVPSVHLQQHGPAVQGAVQGVRYRVRCSIRCKVRCRPHCLAGSVVAEGRAEVTLALTTSRLSLETLRGPRPPPPPLPLTRRWRRL